jgi:Putative restriction endonuclease
MNDLPGSGSGEDSLSEVPMTAAATDIALQDHALPWTEEEFFALGETVARVELFDGSLSVSPSPNYDHQDLLQELAAAIKPAARAVDLWVYIDVDVRLRPGRVVEPDLIIRARTPKGTTVTDAAGVRLVCEITSTNAVTDRVLKMHYYAVARIPWYLLVEPDGPTLLLHRLEGDHYVLVQQAKPGELLHLREPVALDLDPASLVD